MLSFTDNDKRRYEILLHTNRKVLITHAVLLLRTVNTYENKEQQKKRFEKYISNEELVNYIIHFHDKKEENNRYEEDFNRNMEDKYYCPSSTSGDYSPGNPWDAPGMSIRDFI